MNRLRPGTLYISTCIALAILSVAALADDCPDSVRQRATVEGYLSAMQEKRFSDAFDFVTSNITDGRHRADWASMQKDAHERGDVAIYGIDVRDAREHADRPACDEIAIVPNVLRSRDTFNTNGIVEFEIYHVVHDGERWRIDSQETIYEGAVIAHWFPDIELVDVGTVEQLPRYASAQPCDLGADELRNRY